MVAGDSADEEPQRQDVRAGRDGYAAGRDLTIHIHSPSDGEQARAELERQRARRRKDQARRVIVSQQRKVSVDDQRDPWRPGSQGFRRLPTGKASYSLKVTIDNQSAYVIHDVEIEWQRRGVPTGEHATFAGILPGRTEHAFICPEDHDGLQQSSAVVRFRDGNDVLWLRNADSGDLQEVPDNEASD